MIDYNNLGNDYNKIINDATTLAEKADRMLPSYKVYSKISELNDNEYEYLEINIPKMAYFNHILIDELVLANPIYREAFFKYFSKEYKEKIKDTNKDLFYNIDFTKYNEIKEEDLNRLISLGLASKERLQNHIDINLNLILKNHYGDKEARRLLDIARRLLKNPIFKQEVKKPAKKAKQEVSDNNNVSEEQITEDNNQEA